MGKAKRVTLERVSNGFIVRWKAEREWASATLEANREYSTDEERVYIWAGPTSRAPDADG
jgi:hypothetical protein